MPSFHQPLSGIIPPLVTPLRSRDELDHAGLEKLLEHVLAGGVHGIFLLGTTGEAPSLSYGLRRELVERACSQVAGRVPVLVGVTDSSFVESVAMAKHAEQCGADAAVLAPPFYFPAGQPELLEYLQHIVPELTLPVFLYNMPAMTKLTFEPATVLAAADVPGVVGLKDSSGQMTYFHKLLRMMSVRPDFSMLVGPEELLAESVLLGGHGGVTGGANLFPRLYVELYNAAQAGQLERMRALHALVVQISSTIYTVGRHASSIIKGIKTSLRLQDICNDALAEPFAGFREDERKQVGEYLDAIRRELRQCLPESPASHAPSGG